MIRPEMKELFEEVLKTGDLSGLDAYEMKTLKEYVKNKQEKSEHENIS